MEMRCLKNSMDEIAMLEASNAADVAVDHRSSSKGDDVPKAVGMM